MPRAPTFMFVVIPLASVLLAVPRPAEAFDAALFEKQLQSIGQKRKELHERWQKAGSRERRVAILVEARATVVAAVIDTIFPAWMGMPWGLGKDSTATRPFEPGKVVGCSYFVTSVLLNAGLKLSNRFRFAQAPSLVMQRALATQPGAVHRYPGLPIAKLERQLLALGDGLYAVGLNIHTGFIYIRGGEVHVVHASYTSPQTVVDERLADSAVIALSAQSGYIVTPLFQDDRLVELWLQGRPVPLGAQ